MPEPTITKEVYDRLLVAMLEHQVGYRKAADMVGCSYKVAYRAYAEGWPSIHWARPIKKVIKERALKTRAEVSQHKLQDTPQAEKQQISNELSVVKPTFSAPMTATELAVVKSDVVAARREEGLLVKSSRNHALILVSRTQRLNRALEPLVNRAISQIEVMGRSTENMDVHDTLQLVAKIGVLTQQSIDIAERAITLERRVLGEPEVEGSGIGGDMSPDEALAILHGVQETLTEALTEGEKLAHSESMLSEPEDNE